MTALLKVWYQPALILLVPLAILLLVRNDLLQTGYIDPYIYTAFIHDYAETASRIPGTYYSTRLSHILPNALAAAAFGDYAGYISIRYLQLVAATLSIYLIARHYGSELAAWFLTLFFCSHVWLLRALLWEHYDGTVVVYALVGLALLLPRKNEVWTHLGAGFAFAWAFNGNPMGLVIAAAYAPTWLIERTDRTPLTKLKSISFAIVGSGIGYSALIAGMIMVNPSAEWNFDKVTFTMIGWVAAGGGATWFRSFHDIFLVYKFFQPLTLPLFLGFAAIAVLNSSNAEGRRKAIAAFAFILTMVSIYLLFHFWLKAGALGVSFYLSFSLPACVVAVSSLLGQWKPAKRRAPIAILTLFFVIQCAFWLNADLLPFEPDWQTFDNPNMPRFEYMRSALLEVVLPLLGLTFAGLAALALFPGIRRRANVFAIAILLILLASNGLFLRVDTIRVYGEPRWRTVEWDVRNGAIFLQSLVARSVPRGAPVRFWYGIGDANLDLVQSGQLWLWSRLSHPGPSDAQMPTLDDGVRKRLNEGKYVVILGNTPEIESALHALRDDGIRVEVVNEGEYRGRIWSGYKAVVGALR